MGRQIIYTKEERAFKQRIYMQEYYKKYKEKIQEQIKKYHKSEEGKKALNKARKKERDNLSDNYIRQNLYINCYKMGVKISRKDIPEEYINIAKKSIELKRQKQYENNSTIKESSKEHS